MSSDTQQYAPLTQSMVRSLTDKLYEKRKAAALEIERQVRELVKNNNLEELGKVINVLEMLALTPYGNTRKGGLIGLAATAIALGKNSGPYSSKLMEPVFLCFSDADSRVRYFACEALYNIVKICRSAALVKFADLFDILWKLASDTDQNVRSGSELLDRLVKEIVVATPNFDLEHLMVLIRERIYTVNSSNRRFIISWLHTILTVPVFSITSYIPEVVDGVFKALEDPAPAVRDAAASVLTELLQKLNAADENDEENIGGIVNTLVTHANSNNSISRKLAIIWLDQICTKYESKVLSQLSSFFIAILPFIGEPGVKADELNRRLMGLVKSDSKIPIDAIVEVLLAHLRHDKTECRVATLNWIRHLHLMQTTQMFRHMDRFFPVFLELLLDSAEEVLMLDIMLITDICGQTKHSLDIKSLNLKEELSEELKSISPYLIKFNISLLKMFKDEPRLVAERGVQIVRQLCLLLNPAEVFRCIAVLLSSINYDDAGMGRWTIDDDGAQAPSDGSGTSADLEFISKLVAMMSRILLTTCELFQLRQFLRNPEANDCVDLFEKLYRCWCHQPICLIALCLLSQNYNHAVEIVHRLTEVDITIDLLTEIDRLVQLIESPIFAFVRMDLLNGDHQRPLSGVLSALLMLLPQTDAFNTLHKRLQAVPNLAMLDKKSSASSTFSKTSSAEKTSRIRFKELLAHFNRVTAFRTQAIRKTHRSLLNNLAKQ